MISIIVPVYRVEEYLPRCIDSILAQTYRDLEIILVCDESPDRCGEICEEYARKDQRIQVLFKPHEGGISAARNAGLKKVTGEYLGFVDSDDWIEPDMYFKLYNKAKETGADIVECGYFRDFPERVEKWHCKKKEFQSEEILIKFIEDEIDAVLWNKLYKTKLFQDIVFPDGRRHEDDAVMCQLLYQAKKYSSVEDPEYHWWQRAGSLSNVHDRKELLDFWQIIYDQYLFCKDLMDPEHQRLLLDHCAFAISRTWAWFDHLDREEKKKGRDTTRQMTAFSREHFPVSGMPHWGWPVRLGVFLSRYNHPVSFKTAYGINQFKRLFSKRKLHKQL